VEGAAVARRAAPRAIDRLTFAPARRRRVWLLVGAVLVAVVFLAVALAR